MTEHHQSISIWESKEPDDRIESSASEPAAARDALLSLHYHEFCRIAQRVLSSDAALLQLDAEDLAHEAAIRLSAFKRIKFVSRTHFLSFAARLMRHVLIDEVRKRKAFKRQISATHGAGSDADIPVESIDALQHALHKLAIHAPQHARLVQLRCYDGLTIEEIAECNGVSERTIKRQWQRTCAWLQAEIAG